MTRFISIAAVFVLINLFIFIPRATFAQSTVDASILADPAEVTVGDIFTLTLQITHPVDSRATVGQFADPWGAFEIRQIETMETVPIEGGGDSYSTQQIQATLWQTGTYTTPALQVAIVDSEQNSVQVDVEPATITVKSVLQTDDADLRDIKPQATLPFIPLWQKILAGALVALAVIGLLAWWLWRRWLLRRDAEQPVVEEEIAVVVDPRPADVKALEALDKIVAEDLPKQRRFDEQYVRVTDVLRTYLEDGSKISAIDRTTSQVKASFPPNVIELDEWRDLFNLLDEADLVKFAQVEPDLISAEQLPDRARAFIVTTASYLRGSNLNAGRDESTSTGAQQIERGREVPPLSSKKDDANAGDES